MAIARESLGESRPFRRRLQLPAVLVAALSFALAAPPALAQPAGLPSMGAASSAELTPAVEQLLGDSIMEQGRRDPAYIGDIEVNQYLQRLGSRLSAHAPASGQRITVFGVRDEQINAFAMPGGYVGINSGLVTAAQGESELASVVAHEIAHVAQRHIARGMTQGSQSGALALATLVAAVLAGLAGGGDLAAGIATFGQAAAIDQQLRFSRQAEQEADRLGLDMLLKAGYDTRGMVDMFKRMMASHRLNEGVAGSGAFHHSTHPQAVQRLSDIENRLRGQPQRKPRDDPAFWFVRAKLHTLQARDARARQLATQALRADVASPTPARQAAGWYGQAYAALQARRLDEAERHLRQAQGLNVQASALDALSVQLALARNDAPGALKLAAQGQSRWPDDQQLAFLYAEALQQTGRHAEGVKYLRERIAQWPGLAPLWERLARSQERQGDVVEARRSMATYYEMTGALPAAVDQLQQARKLSSDFYTQSEIDARIRQIRLKVDNQRDLLKRYRR